MKTQKIKRKDLSLIYPKMCEGWQKEIANLVLFQSGETIEVENDLISRAYEAADKEQKAFLTKHFEIKSNKIQERIKTWKDVLKESGEKEINILPYTNPKNKEQISQNAFAKIQLISKVLNEGWKPDFLNNNQYKYYPWFEKKSHGWVIRSGVYYFGDYSDLGFGCFYKTSELAVYAGTQFLDIYKEYLPE